MQDVVALGLHRMAREHDLCGLVVAFVFARAIGEQSREMDANNVVVIRFINPSAPLFGLAVWRTFERIEPQDLLIFIPVCLALSRDVRLVTTCENSETDSKGLM